MKIENKFFVVSGASTGIGRAVAIALGKQGAEVALIARSVGKLNETKSKVEEAGGCALVIPADLSQISAVNELIVKIKEHTSHVDGIINIAGIWHGQDEVFAGKDYEMFSQQVIVDTYMVGTVSPSILIHGLLPLMSSKAKIVNLSGTFENGAKGWLPYFVSKKAIEDLTIGLAQELVDKNIQVNCVSPSDTATEAYAKYFPQYMDDAIEPEKIAEQITYLCSSDADGISGKVYVVKKGETPHEGYHT